MQRIARALKHIDLSSTALVVGALAIGWAYGVLLLTVLGVTAGFCFGALLMINIIESMAAELDDEAFEHGRRVGLREATKNQPKEPS